MGSTIFFFLLSLLILVVADSRVIHNPCKFTKNYDICFSSLKATPTGSKKDLALHIINVGIANATDTSAFLNSQLLGSANNPVLNGLLKDCAQKYIDSRDALNSSVAVCTAEDYIHTIMDVAAAQGYPVDCRRAFNTSGLAYPPELALRESNLKSICDVILDIIDHVAA